MRFMILLSYVQGLCAELLVVELEIQEEKKMTKSLKIDGVSSSFFSRSREYSLGLHERLSVGVVMVARIFASDMQSVGVG